jgi:hypothetical protein
MNEDDIRAVVRDAIARHVPSAPKAVERPSAASVGGSDADRRHSSHGLFVLDNDSDGACVIEPAVRCTHCGYCRSYGH